VTSEIAEAAAAQMDGRIYYNVCMRLNKCDRKSMHLHENCTREPIGPDCVSSDRLRKGAVQLCRGEVTTRKPILAPFKWLHRFSCEIVTKRRAIRCAFLHISCLGRYLLSS
jgi:hypothetical protein